jgi:hypothetical protein
MIAVAVAGRLSGDASSPAPLSSASPGASATSQWTGAMPDTAARSPGTARLPASIVCGDIASWWCRRVVLAGIDLLSGEQEATSASVYGSLICGDDLDCPRSFLAGGSPAGSVVLTLADGASAWINVVATGGPRRIGEPPPRFFGRLVRWFPPDA